MTTSVSQLRVLACRSDWLDLLSMIRQAQRDGQPVAFLCQLRDSVFAELTEINREATSDTEDQQ